MHIMPFFLPARLKFNFQAKNFQITCFWNVYGLSGICISYLPFMRRVDCLWPTGNNSRNLHLA